MDLIGRIVSSDPNIAEEYQREFNEWLRCLRESTKEPIKEHEWWKEYIEEEEKINDLPIAIKYFMLADIISTLFKDIEKNKERLKFLFSLVEEELYKANTQQLGEVEILFLEGIINRLLKDEKQYNKFEEMIGPLTGKLVQQNNAFWEELAKSRAEESPHE